MIYFGRPGITPLRRGLSFFWQRGPYVQLYTGEVNTGIGIGAKLAVKKKGFMVGVFWWFNSRKRWRP